MVNMFLNSVQEVPKPSLKRKPPNGGNLKYDNMLLLPRCKRPPCNGIITIRKKKKVKND